MTCRRKTKKEREILSDISKATKNICEKYHDAPDCNDCPLKEYAEIYNWRCELAYVHYILIKNRR